MKETFKALFAASYRSVFTILGITLSVLMVMITANAAYLSYVTYSRIRADIRLEVFPKGKPQDVANFLKLLGGVKSAEILTEDKAKEEFLKHYPQVKDLLERLGDDVFYPIIRVYPKEHWKDITFLDLLGGEIEAYAGVSGVYYGREWLEAAQTFFNFLLGANVVVLGVAFLITLLVSFYTVRFVVHHRRNMIEILRLAGVSPLGLRYPYILLSLIYTVVSWALVLTIGLAILTRYSPTPDALRFNLVLSSLLFVITLITTVFGSFRALADIERGL
ncbi:MAG: hypothetical protein GXO39_08170 [Thermotogae bacterium]|nr:hypothetical protein [Thermotogota bacterium]